MRFTSTVITDDQNPFVIDGLVELHLRDDKLSKPVSHLLGNDVGIHKMLRGTGFVRVAQLNNRLNRVELNKIAVFHAGPVSLLVVRKPF